jgi:hypothetical protein
VASSSPNQDLFHLVLHEIGHAIGIDHRPVSEGLSVMNPSINPALVNDLTMSDIDAVQALYGVRAGSPAFNAQTGLGTQSVAPVQVAATALSTTPVVAAPVVTKAPVPTTVAATPVLATPVMTSPQVAFTQPASSLDGPDAVFRFFDTKTGDHFYTTSVVEKASILATIPNFTYEGVGWAVPDKGIDTIDVFRFFDTKTGQHFFTTSAGERDTIVKTLPSYHYEGVAFQAYANEGAPGSITLDRFLNTETGLHHFAANQAETNAIKAGQAGTGWVYEGHGFTVAAPTDGMLHL